MIASRSVPAGSRRQVLAALALAAVASGRMALAADGKALPLSRSLPDELTAALARREPLVVMVSLDGCAACDVVRNNYLAPMREREGLPVVQVDMQGAQATRGFDGAATTHADLVRAWDVHVAPTLLFVGAGGTEVARRLEGMSADFYASQLDGRLARARKALGHG